MTEGETIEQRVTALEQTVISLRDEVRVLAGGRKPWWEAVIGSMEDYPEFDQVMEYVRLAREAELAAFDEEAAKSAGGQR